MGSNIFVAIIGLSLSTTNQLKSLFQNAVHQQFKITWTNIAHSELDLVILNETLTESSAIKNIKNKNIPILEIHQNTNKENSLLDNKMFIPFVDLNTIKKWIFNNINNKNEENKLPSKHTNILESFNTIFHKSQSNYFICHVNNVQNFIIDKKKHEIWIDENFKPNAISSLNVENLDFDQFVNLRFKKEKHELSLWLWSYLWLNLSETPNLPTHSYYKLKYWPQPKSRIPKETLKIASCLQYGADIQDIKKHLKIESELISKFIYISLASNIIKNIQMSEVKFRLNNDDDQNSTLRSFFSKMRKKLGI